MFPYTNPKHYVTGVTALNIPSKEGTGDWHFQESFYGRGKIKPKISLAGEGESLNTNSILDEFGIYECSSILRECGLPISDDDKIYAADHYRAMLDMIYRCIHQGNFPHHLDIDDWFHSAEQTSFLLESLKQMATKLSDQERQMIESWLAKQA
jgi:hypothetical protein